MRGLNKPSTNITEQKPTISEATISSSQEQITDENGITFLVNLFEDRFKSGSNLMFGNDVSKFSLQSEQKKFFVEILSLLILSQTRFYMKFIFEFLLFLEWPEMVDSALSSPEQTTPLQDDKTTTGTTLPSLPSLSNFDDETKTRILTLLKELGQNENSSSQADRSSTTKLAFIGKNLYVCSTCTGPVQWV